EPEGLGDRHIYVVVRHPAEDIVTGGAIAAIRRRYQDRLSVGVATEVGERCHSQRSHCGGLGQTSGVAGARKIRNPGGALPVRATVGVVEGLPGLEIARVAEEIPLLAVGAY